MCMCVHLHDFLHLSKRSGFLLSVSIQGPFGVKKRKDKTLYIEKDFETQGLMRSFLLEVSSWDICLPALVITMSPFLLFSLNFRHCLHSKSHQKLFIRVRIVAAVMNITQITMSVLHGLSVSPETFSSQQPQGSMLLYHSSFIQTSLERGMQRWNEMRMGGACHFCPYPMGVTETDIICLRGWEVPHPVPCYSLLPATGHFISHAPCPLII